MGQNVLRPGKVHSGTMKRPRINFSRNKEVVAFAILLFKKSENKNISAASTNIQHTLNREECLETTLGLYWLSN